MKTWISNLSLQTSDGYTFSVHLNPRSEYAVEITSEHVQFKCKQIAKKVYITCDLEPLHDQWKAEFRSIFTYFIHFCQETTKAIHLNKQHFGTYVGPNYFKELCYSFGFEHLTTRQAKLLNGMYFCANVEAYYWCKRLLNLQQYQLDYYGFQHAIKQIVKNDDTCVFRSFSHYSHVYPFYFQGAEGQLSFDYENRVLELSLSDGKKEIVPLNPGQKTSRACALLFEKLQASRKLKNLYDPPKYHFNRVMATSPFVRYEVPSNWVYNVLLNHYTTEEIERRCSFIPTIKSAHIQYGVKFFSFLNIYFVLTDKDSIYHTTIISEAKNHFLELVHEKTLQELKDKLDKYIQN